MTMRLGSRRPVAIPPEHRSITRSERADVAAGRASARLRPTEQQQVFAQMKPRCSKPSRFLIGILGVVFATGLACSGPEVEDAPRSAGRTKGSGAVRVAATRDPEAPPPAEPAPATGSAQTLHAAPPHRGSGARPDRSDAGPPSFRREAIDRLLAAGPGWLLGRVPLEPRKNSQGKFAGWRIVSIFEDSPAAMRYGVRPGDLLVRAQGQKIVTPGDLMTVYQRLRGAAEVTVDLIRDGQPLSLRWPILDADSPQDTQPRGESAPESAAQPGTDSP